MPESRHIAPERKAVSEQTLKHSRAHGRAWMTTELREAYRRAIQAALQKGADKDTEALKRMAREFRDH